MIIIGNIHTQNNYSRRVHRFAERLAPLIETGFKIMRIYVKLFNGFSSSERAKLDVHTPIQKWVISWNIKYRVFTPSVTQA